MREQHTYRGYDILVYLSGAEIWRDGEMVELASSVRVAKLIIDGYCKGR